MELATAPKLRRTVSLPCMGSLNVENDGRSRFGNGATPPQSRSDTHPQGLDLAIGHKQKRDGHVSDDAWQNLGHRARCRVVRHSTLRYDGSARVDPRFINIHQ